MFSNSTKLDGTLNPFYTVPDSNRDPFTKAEADAYTALFHYWNTTGDESYNKLITERMNTKRGTQDDFKPLKTNISCLQGHWGMAAMTAAETGFPQGNSMPPWITLARNAFDALESKWDESYCGGGISCLIEGIYDKNSMGNGMLFQLAARLAFATTDRKEREYYASRAVYAWEWAVKAQMVDEIKWSVVFSVSNTTMGGTCVPIERSGWSEIYGLYLSGAAYMYRAVSCQSQ